MLFRYHLPIFLLLLSVAQCPQDLDEDGWTVEQGDCADDWPAVHPGAAELCNGFDDDCDGEVDEDCCSSEACGCWYICDGAGVPCGDGCISAEYECHEGPGSACNGAVD